MTLPSCDAGKNSGLRIRQPRVQPPALPLTGYGGPGACIFCPFSSLYGVCPHLLRLL